MDKKEKNTYMTVGEIAGQAGVTVRTVQYYDQVGLLHPSHRNDRKWRVYTDEDLETLSRILCDRFMGMSLDDIREDLKEKREPVDITSILRDGIEESEDILMEQLQRIAVMKDLERFINMSGELDWKECMSAIDYLQNKWSLVLELNRGIASGEIPVNLAKADDEGMAACYDLIIDTIRLMREGVSPEEDEAANVIGRYEQIVRSKEDGYGGITYEDMININPEIMRTDIAEIPEFWNEIKGYLKAAANTYQRKKETEE